MSSAMIHKFFHHCKRGSHWLDNNCPLLVSLLFLVILRLPNWAEPYWYGDEAIYLTIGNAMRSGERLYAQIIDHKTPLIYYFAMVPNQMWFRTLLLIWMIIATINFYNIGRHLLTSKRLNILATFLFVALTSLPALEGNIPNGELFVMGFILLSLRVIVRTPLFQKKWVDKEAAVLALGRKDVIRLFVAGVFASLGLLTKVPAILDIGALGVFLLWLNLPEKFHLSIKNLRNILAPVVIFGVGVVVPVLVSVGYFWLRGSLSDYLEFGLLYNLHYVGTFNPTFAFPWMATFFTLNAKAAILVLVFLLSSFIAWKNRRDSLLPWLSFWLVATVFATLLSNRPYPHYLLQIVPPLAFLILAFFQKKQALLGRITAIASLALAIGAFLALSFSFYPVVSYYQRYYQLVTNQISVAEYDNEFNGLVNQNTTVAKEIVDHSMVGDRIFIWGTNPMLYALTKQVPAGRFTVAFHIQDLNAYDETFAAIQQEKPRYIVVMKGEQNWPVLNQYILDHYLLMQTTPDMQVYRWSELTSVLILE